MTRKRISADGEVLAKAPARGRKGSQQTAFLNALRISGIVSIAARAAGVSRQRHYEWLDDPEYAKAFEDAMADAGERIESEALRRAMAGWEEPVVSQGKLVYGEDGKPLMKRIYSDRLMELFLRGRRSEVYGVKAQQAAQQLQPTLVTFELRLTEDGEGGKRTLSLPVHEEPIEADYEELA